MNHPLLFLHGLEGNSQGFKAIFLRNIFPEIIIQDYSGDLDERMEQLIAATNAYSNVSLIGSSFGGTMAMRYAMQFPQKTRQIVLLAPALSIQNWESFGSHQFSGYATIYHGRQDDIVNMRDTLYLAEKLIRYFAFHVVDDDHRLQSTVQNIDWKKLIHT